FQKLRGGFYVAFADCLFDFVNYFFGGFFDFAAFFAAFFFAFFAFVGVGVGVGVGASGFGVGLITVFFRGSSSLVIFVFSFFGCHRLISFLSRVRRRICRRGRHKAFFLCVQVAPPYS